QALDELLGGEMVVDREDGAQELAARRGELEPAGLEVGLEDLFLAMRLRVLGLVELENHDVFRHAPRAPGLRCPCGHAFLRNGSPRLPRTPARRLSEAGRGAG